jgi:hypothetical protein
MYYNFQLMSNGDPLTIRWITGEDAVERGRVERLAALDSQRTPAGPYLMAETGGRPIAARSMRDGTVVADPFTYSADAVRMLEIRAEALLSPMKTRDPALARRSHAASAVGWLSGRARRAFSSAAVR